MCTAFFSTDQITAIATSFAALIALAAVFVVVWQTRFTTRVQTLLQCDARWFSEEMRATRRKAAGSLLREEPSPDVDRVLDFFETIAGLFVKPHGFFRTSALPNSWARHSYYWDAVCYWTKSRDYIDTVRARPSEKAAWEDLDALMRRWVAEEGGPTSTDIDLFLHDEAGQ